MKSDEDPNGESPLDPSDSSGQAARLRGRLHDLGDAITQQAPQAGSAEALRFEFARDPRPGRMRVLVALVALVVLAAVAVAVRSSDNPAVLSTPTSTTVAPLQSPVVLAPLPQGVAAEVIGVEGSTGWILSQTSTAAVWKVPVDGVARKVLGSGALDGFDGRGGISAAVWSHGVAVFGSHCTDPPGSSPECASQDGTVVLFSTSGRRIATVRLWKSDNPNLTGGPPRFVGVHADRLWVSGGESLWALDARGNVTAKMRRPASVDAVCWYGDQLYGVSSIFAQSVTLQRWTGTRWIDVPHSTLLTADTDHSATQRCGALGVTVAGSTTVVHVWSATHGWRRTDNAAVLGNGPTSGPWWTDDGVAYRIDANWRVWRIDPASGRAQDTDLTLRSRSPATGTASTTTVPLPLPGSLSVAERDGRLFACTAVAPRHGGLITTCGFAPVPKR